MNCVLCIVYCICFCRSCAAGSIPGCSCDRSIHTRRRREAFQWGGCSDDVIFGCQFSQEFVDAAEDGNTPASKINIHNNEVCTAFKAIIVNHIFSYSKVGRRVLRKSMKKLCKCHGVSGSCSMKVGAVYTLYNHNVLISQICWRTLQSFRHVGKLLVGSYDTAVR